MSPCLASFRSYLRHHQKILHRIESCFMQEIHVWKIVGLSRVKIFRRQDFCPEGAASSLHLAAKIIVVASHSCYHFWVGSRFLHCGLAWRKMPRGRVAPGEPGPL